MAEKERTGIVLMTFGSPSSPADVKRYLTSVRGGREPDAALVSEFERRYRLVGGSPLLARTQEQATALARRLQERDPSGCYQVAVGMRHSSPTIAESIAHLAGLGVSRVFGIILSPQYSPLLMGGYSQAFEAAIAPFPAIEGRVAGAWYKNPHFVAGLAQAIRTALGCFPEEERTSVAVLLTAHSVPKAVADREPEYLEQLQETAQAVAEAAELAPGQWQFAYQSAGHTPEPWLTPDLKDLFPRLRALGYHAVLIAPVQFLADHLEVLYDIDIAARAEADRAGLRLERTASLNASPYLIEALADVVLEQIAQEPVL